MWCDAASRVRGPVRRGAVPGKGHGTDGAGIPLEQAVLISVRNDRRTTGVGGGVGAMRTSEAPVGDDPVDGEVMARLEEIYRREYRELVPLAHLLVGDGARAEEIVQDAFLRLVPHLGGAANPGGYLRTIVVNLCRDEHRRAARARRHLDEEPLFVAPPGIPQTSSAVWIALQQLPARQREALSLRYYADLPTEEIARILAVRPATVRSLIHRGLGALKEVVPRD